MAVTPFYFSLRWKFVLLFGSLFLLMHSIFSYFFYRHAQENFAVSLQNQHKDHIHILQALTDESYITLEQIAELLPLLGTTTALSADQHGHSLKTLDENWLQWQLSWGIENVVFYNIDGAVVKSWGESNFADTNIANKVLQFETPEHLTVCVDICFQQVTVPVIGKTETIGAYAVTRSFADIMISYQQATTSNLGILFRDQNSTNIQGPASWPYRLAGLTFPKANKKLYDFVVKNVSFASLSQSNQVIRLDGNVFEIGISAIPGNSQNAPHYLLINDVTTLSRNLDIDLKKIWLQGFLSLFVSLLLLPILLHTTLSRITRLSEALPLLAERRYENFRERLVRNPQKPAYVDELEQLHQTALRLATQLQSLEQEIHRNTLKIVEKSRELATERDFIQELVETAPVIILTQQLNGVIQTANQTGEEVLGDGDSSLKGKIFDLLIPEYEWAHHKKLNQLRTGELVGRFQIDGQLIINSGKVRNVSWRHIRFSPPNNPNEAVILTIGVDIGERAQTERKDSAKAGIDPATGLYNQERFISETGTVLAAARRYRYTATVLVFDIDAVPYLVDAHGTSAAETLLAWAARRIKGCIRSSDRFGRLYGNRFALLATHTDSGGISVLAQKIDHIIGDSVFNFAGSAVTPRLRIGIAFFPDHGLTAAGLCANAESARLEAASGKSGRLAFCNLSAEHLAHLSQLSAFRQQLEKAIKNDRFFLRYLPVRYAASNQIHHYECLVYLHQENGEPLPSKDFNAYAEALDMSGKIDRIVLNKSLQGLLTAASPISQDLRLAIKLSASTTADSEFYEDAAYLFACYGINPRRIILETSEAAIDMSPEKAIEFTERFVALGAGVALDNFGISCSAFQYLQTLPLEYVKIDSRFSQNLASNSDDRVYFESLSESAHAFGKLSVATHIERQDQLDAFIEFAVDLAQGPLVGEEQSTL